MYLPKVRRLVSVIGVSFDQKFNSFCNRLWQTFWPESKAKSKLLACLAPFCNWFSFVCQKVTDKFSDLELQLKLGFNCISALRLSGLL